MVEGTATSPKKKSAIKQQFSGEVSGESPLQNRSKNKVAIDDSAGGKSAPVPECSVRKSFDSKSYSGSGGGLTMAEIKRLQYSQKHHSTKVNIALGPGNNESNSNSLIGGNFKNQNKRKSLQNKSHDSNSHKSDPLIQNQNRLNKFSSGSHTDSNYILNSGESFQYQGFPSRMNPLQRQSKSMIRQAQGGYANNN